MLYCVCKRVAGRGCTGYRRGWQDVAVLYIYVKGGQDMAVLSTEEGGRTGLSWVLKRVDGSGCSVYGRWWQGVAVLGTEEGGRAWQ